MSSCASKKCPFYDENYFDNCHHGFAGSCIDYESADKKRIKKLESAMQEFNEEFKEAAYPVGEWVTKFKQILNKGKP